MRFKAKMRYLEPDWADQIWTAARAKNRGRGVAWLLPLAALAITGARPASLERGITFEVKRDQQGKIVIEGIIPGAKLLTGEDGKPRRGQKEVRLTWHVATSSAGEQPSHRQQEFEAIAAALFHTPQRRFTIRYDAEAISTRLRELSRELWPRRQHHVSGVCYREAFSASSKAAGVDPAELAAAMGHISAESQGRYAGRPRHSRGPIKPSKRTFSSVVASTAVRIDRAPMARFARASAIKKRLKV